MSGLGERCMFCSGSECSQVEHYRPKTVFPLEAMTWENFLWVCGICNQKKGHRFPPHTEPGEILINPIAEDVWAFFFIDEFGNLTQRWRQDLNRVDPRADTTVTIVGLDREALQQSRQARLVDLKQRISDSLILFARGELTVHDLRQRVDEWVAQPFQPDVADYFLRGPGNVEAPFAQLIAAMNP